VAAWLGGFFWFHRILEGWLDTGAVGIRTYCWAKDLAICLECAGVPILLRSMLRLGTGRWRDWGRKERIALRVVDALCAVLFLTAVLALWWSLRQLG